MVKNRVPDFSCEDEMQEWLENEFESAGWTAIREVKPHHSRCRADLIAQHDEYGWIGVECKYMSSPRNGRKVGEAIDQIVNKYRGRKYVGNRIDLWAFCPYYYKDDARKQPQQTIRELLCYFGIGVIELDKSGLIINFDHSDRDKKIKVSQLTDWDDGREYGSIDAIQTAVEPKLERI